MSRITQRISVFFLACWLGASFAPALAFARGCVVTCVRGTETRTVPNTTITSDTECQKLCTGAPAQGTTPAVASACNSLGTPPFTCRGPAVFTPDGTDPSSPVCSCTCVPAAGTTGSPVTVQTNEHCPSIATNSPGCASSCTARCASATAPVRAGMRPDPDHQPSCVAPPAAAPAAPTAPASNNVNAPDSAGRNAVPLTLSQPIDGVTVVSDLGNYIAVIYKYAIGLAATAAVIMIVYGGFRYLLGSAMSEVGEGKQIIQDALIGLLLVLGSYMILSTVNPNTLSLKLPNIQPVTPKTVPGATISEVVQLATQNTSTQSEINTGQNCNADTECTCNAELCTRFFGRSNSTAPVVPQACATPPARCQSNSCIIRCQPQGSAQTAQNAQRATQLPLITCSLDRGEFGCPTGQSCLRSGLTVNGSGVLLVGPDRAAKQGYCSDGREGARCRCSLRGCDLTDSGSTGRLGTLFPGRTLTLPEAQALQPTNNNWSGSQPCQTGLRCVAEGTNWICRRDPSAPPAPAPTPTPAPTP